MKEKVLLTGGTGFIGSFVADKLVAGGYNVLIYDIATIDASIQKDRGKLVHVKGDIFDLGSLERVMRNCDVVIHMVGLPIVGKTQTNPQLSYELNVSSIQYTLEAMRRSGLKKLIYPSSAAVYGITKASPVSEDTKTNPTNVYAYHKLIAEELCKCYSKNYGIDSTILRLFNVYGGHKGQGVINLFIENAKAGLPLKINGGKQLRDFTHVDDVSRVFIKSIEEEKVRNEVINVGSGRGRSINDIAGLVKEFFPDIELKVERGKEEYDSVADISKLKRILGLEPDASTEKMKKTIEDMVQRT